MSVLIKGMGMPTDCDSCWMPAVMCLKWKETDVGERNKYCPLVEVPPHGRLIDADKLKSFYKDEGMHVSKLAVMASINNSETIIEAEGEENG